MRERRNNLKPFSIIGLKFLDKNGIPSKKTYEYYLDEEMTDYFKSFHLNSTSFVIVNENGYNYRDSEVVVHYWKKLPLDVRDDLLFITRVEMRRNWIPPESRCYDSSTPFNEKEIDMALTKSISTAISTVADAAKTANDNFNALSAALNYKYSDSTGTLNQPAYDTWSTSTSSAPMIHFDSKGITISDNTELNLNYEKVYDKLEKVKEERNRKETKKMFEKVMKNFKFGKCGEGVKMSVYGPAFRDYEGNYIAFNGEEAMDVTGMTFNFDCFYKMPVAQDDVEIGDYVYHLDDPVKVVDVTERGSLVCVRLFSHEEVTVVPIKNMFGFNFFTKLVNFGEGLFGANTIDKSNPFGSMLPLFLMSNGSKNDNLMMAMMMSQGNLDFKSNPFMMMALMSDSKDRNDAILPLMMSQMLMPKVPVGKVEKCKCGCHQEGKSDCEKEKIKG